MRLRIFIFFFLITPFVASSQVKEAGKLEMLFDQQHYKKVYKKSNRMIKKKKYENEAFPHLFVALSSFRLSQEKSSLKKLKTSLGALNSFFMKDTSGAYTNYYHSMVTQLKRAYYYEAYQLKQAGKERKAQMIFDETVRMFNDTLRFQYLPSLFNASDIPSPPKTNPSISSLSLRDSIVLYAQSFKGTPYLYGGNDPKGGFDCSGYTKYVLENNGLTISRTASSQGKEVIKVSIEEANKGDLAFFGDRKGKKMIISHVGIVVSSPGEDLMVIHSTSSSGVRVDNISQSSYWKPRLLYIGTVLDGLSREE